MWGGGGVPPGVEGGRAGRLCREFRGRSHTRTSPLPTHPPTPPPTHTLQIHDAQGIAKMRAAGALASRVLAAAGALVAPGVTTDEIDKAVHAMTVEAGAYPSPLNYGRFPKSVCTSVNEVSAENEGWGGAGAVAARARGARRRLAARPPLTPRSLAPPPPCAVHLPRHPRLEAPEGGRHCEHRRHRVPGCEEEGGWVGLGGGALRAQAGVSSLLRLALTPNPLQPAHTPVRPPTHHPPHPPTRHPPPQGYHGDTSRMFYVGRVPPEAAALCEATREALDAGIAVCGPGVPVKEIGRAIHSVADARKLGLVRAFVGHGVGRVFHSYPHIFHFRRVRACVRGAWGEGAKRRGAGVVCPARSPSRDASHPRTPTPRPTPPPTLRPTRAGTATPGCWRRG